MDKSYLDFVERMGSFDMEEPVHKNPKELKHAEKKNKKVSTFVGKEIANQILKEGK